MRQDLVGYSYAQAPKPELSRLELALSARFGECSIVAAETAKLAEDRVNTFGTPATLRLFTPEMFEPLPVEVDFVCLSEGLDGEDGRTIYLGLYRPRDAKIGDNVTLTAVTRGDIAIPLARFARRENSPVCDFVQIGEEMEDSNFIVTINDEMSRRDLVELIRDIVGVHPELVGIPLGREYPSYSHQHYERERKRSEHASKVGNHVRGLTTYSATKGSSTYNSKGIEAVAVLERFYPQQMEYGPKRQAEEAFPWVKLHLKKSRAALDKFMENPSLAAIERGEVPGSRDEVLKPVLRKAAIGKLRVGSKPYNKQKLEDLLSLLYVRDKFDKVLGETIPVVERVLRTVGQLSLTATETELEGIIRKFKFSGVEGDVALRAKITRRSPTATVVSISGKPEAQDEGFEPVYDYVLDRASRHQIDEVEANELSLILGYLAPR